MYADLHTHSTYSDGTNTPNEIVDIAVQNSVKVISLVDHDTVEGIGEFLLHAEKSNIEGIPGVEISTSVNKVRIHILGYYINIRNKKLLEFFDEISKVRTDNTKNILDKLCNFGQLKYEWERVLEHHRGKKWLCSSHVFEAMMKDGFYTSWNDWTEFYHLNFSKNSKAYIDIGGFSSKDAINIILEADGLPVVAHPKLIGNDEEVKKLIKNGLQGIEVFYPAHSKKDVERYINLAKSNNLVVTGGTDWHGNLTEWDVDIGEFGVERLEIDCLKKKKKEIHG